MISKNNLSQRFQTVMDELSSKMSENKLVAKEKLGDFIESGLPPVQSEMVIATLNGAIGDYLAQRNSRFLQPMLLRDQHQTLNLEPGQLDQQLARCTERIVVCVHGWCMNDVQWKRKEHDHGRSLSQYGYTPVYLRYNTGLHISENGENFARMLEALVASWPCRVKELVIIGHSMGGLVTRSACYYAEQHQLNWLSTLHTFITLGSPHNGAPLAKLACWIDDRIADTPYLKMLTRLSEIRSSGTKDLSQGHIRHTDWQPLAEPALPQERPPLPQGVACYAIASCLGQNLDDEKNLRLGDGLVPVASALGAAGDNYAALNYPSQHQWVAGGINHIDLLIHPHIAKKVQQWVLFNTAE
ncbi:GPI inositol-deacylase [Photobacterium atrarenae]|uniref:GPI inositol-deacylase n=1 Tax=Photobacterium atrarenae TaxID=865757 RepID=A0ABY5GHV9_9GAMM|nr:GPI inositol-deacylase [Photobacterium atrarenae]UTV28849.1 GPI inositol-deacylase [Photobacterium atrarenae]